MGSAQITVELNPLHDASVWQRAGNTDWVDLNTGADPDLDAYSYSSGDDLNAYSYIQFDLSGLNIDTINSATLTLTQVASNPENGTKLGGHSTRNDTLVTDRVRIYGLNAVAGNTPQNWDESTITWNTLGSEVFGSAEDPFNVGSGKATDFSALESISSGVVTLSDATVTAFIMGRSIDDGRVTFMVDFQATARGAAFVSSEGGVGQPILTLDFVEGISVIPEPSAVALLVGFGAMLFGLRRRR